MSTLTTLPRKSFHANWRIAEIRQPDFIVLDMGESLEPLAEAVASTLVEAQIPGMHVGTPTDVARRPGSLEAIRAVLIDRMVHRVASDVILRRQGNDLYVHLKVSSYTWIKYLRVLLYVTAFVAIWCMSFGFLFLNTGIYRTVIRDYVRKQVDTNAADTTAAKTEGLVYDEAKGTFVRTRSAAPVKEVFKEDPWTAFTAFAGIGGVLAAAAGVLLRLVPAGMFRTACRLVGWPTPEEFQEMAGTHAAWVDSQVSNVLFRHFGITGDRIIHRNR